jgi:hypothetical protein
LILPNYHVNGNEQLSSKGQHCINGQFGFGSLLFRVNLMNARQHEHLLLGLLLFGLLTDCILQNQMK